MEKQAPRGGNGNGAIDVLLVEDNPAYVELTLRALGGVAGGDLRVEVAGDGERALDILVREKPPRRPRLVILDIKLPKLGGHEVLRQVRANPATRYLPVVMFSSSNAQADIAESYRLGAYRYFVRPLTFESYVDVLANVIAYWLVYNVAAQAQGAD